ncbi:MAG: inseCt neurotoxin 1c [Blautia faecis]
MSEFLFFTIGTMLGGLVRCSADVLLADKPALPREEGLKNAKAKVSRYFSVLTEEEAEQLY